MYARKMTAILFAIAMTVCFASVPAQAQSQRNGQGVLGNLIAALNNINVQTGDITVIDGDVLENVNVRALNNALNRNNIELFNGADSDVIDLDVQDVLNDLEIDVNVEDVTVLVNVLTGQLVGIIVP